MYGLIYEYSTGQFVVDSLVIELTGNVDDMCFLFSQLRFGPSGWLCMHYTWSVVLYFKIFALLSCHFALGGSRHCK